MAVGGVIIPDGILQDSLQKALDYIRYDYNSNSDKTKTLLYRIFPQDQGIGTQTFYNQMVKTLITTKRDAHHIIIGQGYDPNDQKYPGIYINMADENESESALGLGEGDHGLGDSFVDGELEDSEPMYFDDDESQEYPILSKGYKSRYYITILTKNRVEMIGLYHFFKALILSMINHANELGLQNMTLSAQSPVFDSRIPAGVHIRVLNVSMQYTSFGHSFYGRIIPSVINLQPIIDEIALDSSTVTSPVVYGDLIYETSDFSEANGWVHVSVNEFIPNSEGDADLIDFQASGSITLTHTSGIVSGAKYLVTIEAKGDPQSDLGDQTFAFILNYNSVEPSSPLSIGSRQGLELSLSEESYYEHSLVAETFDTPSIVFRIQRNGGNVRMLLRKYRIYRLTFN